MAKAFLLLLALTVSSLAWAQNDTPGIDSTWAYDEDEDYIEIPFNAINDTTQVHVRTFSQSTIDSLKADDELSYQQPPTVAESLWQRIKRWLGWLLRSLFERTTTTDIGRFIIYVLVLGALIVIVLTLLRVNAFRMFYSADTTSKPGYQVFHENIHDMDFETLIREATGKKEFRLATRLVFLQALKILADKNLIDFAPGKTNHDYVDEVTPAEIKTGLNQLSYYFDYAWYGNFSITEKHFENISQTFSSWKEKIK
ncbi:MAG: DUF4129 domain-containing protein [Cytophagales bacterium]|nr:DUF4129 domain-containing protein [Cytophagales bacterium]